MSGFYCTTFLYTVKSANKQRAYKELSSYKEHI